MKVTWVDGRDTTSYAGASFVERVIFNARYALAVGYIGMTLVLAAFLARMFWDSAQLARHMLSADTSVLTIGILEILDDIMIANVVYLIISGSYLVYVKDRIEDPIFRSREDRPSALRHITPTGLKEKMAASLVGVSSVHLLQVLILTGTPGVHTSWHDVGVKVGIHAMLIVGLLVFARINRSETEET